MVVSVGCLPTAVATGFLFASNIPAFLTVRLLSIFLIACLPERPKEKKCRPTAMYLVVYLSLNVAYLYN